MLAPEWNRLDASLLRVIRDRLGSEFAAFAEVCQDVGLLEKNFTELSQSMTTGPVKMDTSFTCSMCGSSVVSAANHFAGQAELALAQKLALWALKLEPSHVPALVCLATIADVSGNPGGAAKYRSAMERICDRVRRTAPGQLSDYERGLLESL